MQRRLCRLLQAGLPICGRPFAALARSVDSDEQTVLKEIRELEKAGVVRRVGAFINYRALGFAGTLAAAHVPANKLPLVTEAVNSLDGVSHNYLRKHHYNLWFTVQGRSAEEIERTLAGLSERFDIGFYSLPVERVFKLDVRFDLEGEDETVLEEAVRVPRGEVVKLREKEKRILSRLQDELEIKAKAFDFLCEEELGEKEVLQLIEGLIDKGVIRRIGGVLDHRKLGYTANVMFCCEVGKEDVAGVAEQLARLRMVSHCYERRAMEDWPYNLYAMLHGRSMGEIEQAVDRFVESEKIDSFELLATEAELKKRPVRHEFGEA